MSDNSLSKDRLKQSRYSQNKYQSVNPIDGQLHPIKIHQRSLQRKPNSQYNNNNNITLNLVQSKFRLIPQRIQSISQQMLDINHSPTKSSDSPQRNYLKQSRILKSSIQNQRLSPENRIAFTQKLRKINESISYMQSRQNDYYGISQNCYTEMCEMINKTETLTDYKDEKIPQIKLIKVEQNVLNQNENFENITLVEKLANHGIQLVNENRRKQRNKLEQSVYYKTNKWQKAKHDFLKKFEMNKQTFYAKKFLITQLKIPYLRYNSKSLFMSIKQKNYSQVLKHLSHNKSLVYEVDNDLLTPLHISCQLGLFDITKLLLRFNADVNAIDKNKKTPLYYSMFNCQTQIVKILLIHDAYPFSENHCNYTQFFQNKVLKDLIRVAKRIYTLTLICHKNFRKQMKEHLEINYFNDYSLPSNLLKQN